MLKSAEGRLILASLFEQQPELDSDQVVRKRVCIHGSWAWTGDNFRQAIALVQSGQVSRKPPISHEPPCRSATRLSHRGESRGRGEGVAQTRTRN